MRKELRRAALILAFALVVPTLAVAQDDRFRPSSFSSLGAAKARAFGADFFVDNRDRDPHRTDVFDAGLRFRFQLGEKTELFANIIADRVVALPETPAVPPSPTRRKW